METLQHTFLEDPTYVYVLLSLAWLGAFFLWRARRDRRSAMILWIPPMLIGAVFLVERLVVTDREMILGASQEIAADLSRGRFDATEKYLDRDFTGHWTTKALAIAAGKEALRTHEIRVVTIRSPRVEINGKLAVMNVVTVIESSAGYRAALAWKIHWTKFPEGWRIIDVDKPETLAGL